MRAVHEIGGKTVGDPGVMTFDRDVMIRTLGLGLALILAVGCSRTAPLSGRGRSGPSGSIPDSGRMDRPDGGFFDAGFFDAGFFDGGVFDGGFLPDARFDGGAEARCLGRVPDVIVELGTQEFNVQLRRRIPPGLSPNAVVVRIVPDAIVGSEDTLLPALTTAGLPESTVLCLIVDGALVGAGGAGGSGGNGGSGGMPRGCSRNGAPGGPAVALTIPTQITLNGIIAGGGGGGGGASGCNDNVGGGGGAGFVPGRGGAGASFLSDDEEIAFCGQDNGVREGTPGQDSFGPTGGEGGITRIHTGGRGGELGQPGSASVGCSIEGGQGGASGAAILLQDNAPRPEILGPGVILGPVR